MAPVSFFHCFICALILMVRLHKSQCFLKFPHAVLQRPHLSYCPTISNSVPCSRSTNGGGAGIRMLRATIDESEAVGNLLAGNDIPERTESEKIEDATIMASLLRNISIHMDDLSSTEIIFGLVSQRLDWLLSMNMSVTMQTMLEQNAAMHSDTNMIQSYAFLLDVLEKVAERSSTMTINGAALLSDLLLAANSTEAELDEYITLNEGKLLGSDFQVFLDSQIEQAAKDGAIDRQSVLETAKLRLLKQMGNKYGEFIKALSELVIEEDAEKLEADVVSYLQSSSVLTPDRLKDFLHTTQQGIRELANQANGTHAATVRAKLIKIKDITVTHVRKRLEDQKQMVKAEEKDVNSS